MTAPLTYVEFVFTFLVVPAAALAVTVARRSAADSRRVLAGLAVVTVPDAGLRSLLALYLVLLAVLTLPHALVVTWMDRREGVWSV